MAVVTVTTMGVWGCPCGNLFGVSHWPMTLEQQHRFTHRNNKPRICSECDGRLSPTGTNRSWVEDPV